MLKTKKRLFSVVTAVMVLIMSLAFVMPAVRVAAAEGNWSEHSTGTFTGGGSGSSESPLKISSANELANLIRLINTNESNGAYREYCYELTADIDLGGYEWTPLGTSTYKFEGSFDGKDHKIKNLTISSGNYVGLFGYIGTNGSIKNVAIESGSITGSEKAAGVCAANFGGSIENCSNAAIVSGFSYVGGICGFNKGNVTGCTNFESGKVKGTASSESSLGSYIGGICGYSFSEIAARNDVIVSNCSNYAEIGENLYNNASGGICGYNGGIVQDCHNYYNVSGYSKVGGVCGETSTDIKDSSNTGTVKGTTGNVGGICGYCNQATDLADFIIENCTNTGDVTCTSSDGSDCKVGGVCGISNIKISNCKNSGKVYSPNPVIGGICGEIDDSSIIGCSNSGEISSYRMNVGGVCGINYNSTIEESYNTGKVFVDKDNVIFDDPNYRTYVGGVCGNNWGNFDDDQEEIIAYSKIKDCYNTGEVSSPGYSVGGVCGYSWAGIIEGCYNTEKVSGFGSVSGVCGESQLSIVKNCYNTGASSGNYCIGGVSGYNWFSLIEKCYNIGLVTGADGSAGSVCGENDTDDYDCGYVDNYEHDIKNCYYNKDLTTLGGISGSDTESVKGLSTIEMTCGETLSKMGFDTAEWDKKPNDKTNKEAYYPNQKAFTEVPSIGYETKLSLALSDENAEYSCGGTIDFDVSALVKFDGMTAFAADTNETPLASGKGSFTIVMGDETVVTSTDINDNTIKNVTSSEISTSGDDVTFTLNYDGTGSDYFADAANVDTCEVTITSNSPTADDFNFTAPSNLVYDGKAKTAAVTAKTGITGIGTITVKYYDAQDNKLDSAPIVPGKYTVQIDVADGDNYSAATGLTANSWTFTIEKAEPTITVAADPASDIAGKTITVTVSAKNPNNEALTDIPAPTLTYKVGENGTETAFTDTFVIPEGTANGTVITITAKTAGNDNYNAGTGTATVTVTDCKHTDKTTAWEKDNTGHWHICNYCGAEVDKAEHTEDDGTVTTEPSETTEGEMTFKCTECGYVIRTETIPVLEPSNPEDPEEPSNPEDPEEPSNPEDPDEPSNPEDPDIPETPEEKVNSFVERLYENILGRHSDPSKETHIDNLTNGETATKVAYDFVFSSEFTNLDISNEERVRIMYLTFLNREPDPAGLATWTKALDNGCSIGHIFYGFTQSPEFGEICKEYGIEQGTWEYVENRDKSAELTSFVSRLYTKALGRKYDVNGLNDHTGNYLENHDLYQMAYNFIFSPEFIEKDLSDEDFVDTMYRTFFDREADPDGRADWLGRLKSGASREDVLAGFVGSQECADLVARFGI